MFEAIRKINIYIDKIDQQECDNIRTYILTLMKEILMFSAS